MIATSEMTCSRICWQHFSDCISADNLTKVRKFFSTKCLCFNNVQVHDMPVTASVTFIFSKELPFYHLMTIIKLRVCKFQMILMQLFPNGTLAHTVRSTNCELQSSKSFQRFKLTSERAGNLQGF